MVRMYGTIYVLCVSAVRCVQCKCVDVLVVVCTGMYCILLYIIEILHLSQRLHNNYAIELAQLVHLWYSFLLM